MVPQLNPQENEDSIDLGYVLKVSLRYWKRISGTVVFFLALAICVILLAPKIYRAEVLVAPALDEDGLTSKLGGITAQVGGLVSLAGLDFGQGMSRTDEAIAFLQSRKFSIDLMQHEHMVPLLLDDAFIVNGSDNNELEYQSYLLEAYDVLDQDIRGIYQDPDTGLVTITMEWRDPAIAARWANATVDLVNERLRARAIEEAESAISYLEEALKRTDVVAVQQAIYRIIESQVNSIMLANVRKEFAFRVIDPAIPPAPDDYVWPNWPLLLGVALVLGLAIGLVSAFVSARRSGIA